MVGVSEKVEVTCDACGRDLTATGNCEDYRLVVKSEALPAWWQVEGLGGGAVTAMAVSKPIQKPHHFCGLFCLHRWLDENYGEQHEAWKARASQ